MQKTIKLKNNYKIHIDCRELSFICLLILYVQGFMTKLVNIPYWYRISVIVILISDFFFCMYFVFTKRLSKYILATAAFFLYPVVITVFREPTEVFHAFERSVFCISIIVTLEFMFQNYTVKSVVNLLMHLVEVLNYANLISMVLFPSGLYHTVNYGSYEAMVKNPPGYIRTSTSRVHWLLGHQTGIMKYILPTLCIAFLYSYIKTSDKKITLRTLFLIIACFFEIMIANSATNYVVFGLFIVTAIGLKFRGSIRLWYFVPGIIAGYTFLFHSAGNIPLLDWLSVKMQRPVEIASRILVWKNVLSGWSRHPIFGCGYINEQSSEIWSIFGVANPHSGYLWVLFEGGIVGGILFILYIFFTCRNLRKVWQNNMAIIIYASVIALLIAMVTDDYIFRAPFSVIIFVLSFHISDFYNNKDFSENVV